MDVINIDDDIDGDEYFLSMVDAAEARALSSSSSKRPKTSTTTAVAAEEGSYMAALRGSRSSLWQQQQQKSQAVSLHHKGARGSAIDRVSGRIGDNTSVSSAPASGGACFKCGLEGHWAMSCTSETGGTYGGSSVASSRVGGFDSEVAEKQCRCGSGACLVLTSNTQKNPGRKFYKCPLKEENGGCNFFEWCDSQSPGNTTSGYATVLPSRSVVPDLPCPCGSGSCVILVTKTGKNEGRQYYRCPAKEGNSCGFFKWCSDQMVTSNLSSWKLPVRQDISSDTPSSVRGSPCFKSGQEGHWAMDRPSQSLHSGATDLDDRSFTSLNSNTCFRCNKPGHWASNCPLQDICSSIGGRSTLSSFGGRSNYKQK